MTTVALTGNFLATARCLTFSDAGGVSWNFNPNTNTLTASATAGGTFLSSVGFADLSTAPIYTIANSPLTANGTLDITLKTQTANYVFAGPTTGVAAQPTFRALVSADIPNNAASTTGTAAGLSVTLAATSGGTGQSVYAVGDLLYASSTTALSRLADVARGSYLASGGVGTAPAWTSFPSIPVGANPTAIGRPLGGQRLGLYLDAQRRRAGA